VDDISDDEGDEEAGRAARLAQEREDDRLATKKVITAVTLGHEAVRNANKKGKYAFDKLTAGRDDDKRPIVEDGGEEEEEDYEERLQRGLSERNQSEMMKRRSGMNGDDSEDDYQSESDEDEEMYNGEELTEDQRRTMAENKQRIRDQQDAAIIKRKQFEQHTKMKRALRRKLQADSQNQSQSQANEISILEASLSMNPFDITGSYGKSKMGDSSSANQSKVSDPTATTAGVKRRTTTMPKQITNKGLTRPPISSRSTSMYSGTLNQGEIMAGM
jgi:hypothetical protein